MNTFVKEGLTLVKNETNANFDLKNGNGMDLKEHLQQVKDERGGMCSFALTCRVPTTETVCIEHGFFFILVVEGEASFSRQSDNSAIRAGDLIVLSPSMSVEIHDTSPSFCLSCIHIFPDYFDCLPDGQPLYNQLASFLGHHIPPVIHLEEEQEVYLRKLFALFSEQLQQFQLYKGRVVGHLCEVLLLQVTELLCRYNRYAPLYVKRSNEIFRQFKKLLMANYKVHHEIRFYADSLYISTTYLSRIVKGITGNTIHFHISELVCSDARKLLECTDMDVKEIAAALGFSDQSVFGKFFVVKTGMSPLKYRKSRTRDKS